MSEQAFYLTPEQRRAFTKMCEDPPVPVPPKPDPEPETPPDQKPKRKAAVPATHVLKLSVQQSQTDSRHNAGEWAHQCRVLFVKRVIRKMTKTPRPGVLFCEHYCRCLDTLISGKDTKSRGYHCSVHWLQRMFPKLAALLESYIAKEIRRDNTVHGMGGLHGWSGPQEYVVKAHSINHSHDWYLWQEPGMDDAVKIYERDIDD